MRRALNKMGIGADQEKGNAGKPDSPTMKPAESQQQSRSSNAIQYEFLMESINSFAKKLEDSKDGFGKGNITNLSESILEINRGNVRLFTVCSVFSNSLNDTQWGDIDRQLKNVNQKIEEIAKVTNQNTSKLDISGNVTVLKKAYHAAPDSESLRESLYAISPETLVFFNDEGIDKKLRHEVYEDLLKIKKILRDPNFSTPSAIGGSAGETAVSAAVRDGGQQQKGTAATTEGTAPERGGLISARRAEETPAAHHPTPPRPKGFDPLVVTVEDRIITSERAD